MNNIHDKENLHDWKLPRKEKEESWTETIFTGLCMLACCAVVMLIYVVALQHAPAIK